MGRMRLLQHERRIGLIGDTPEADYLTNRLKNVDELILYEDR